MNGVTILIPTFYANQMLYNCVASIMASCPSAKVLIYKNDIGWLKACNRLMREISDDVILLNDDTLILTNIVEEMRKVAYSDDKIGIVGGKSLSSNGEIVTNYGIYIAPDGNTAHKYYGKHRNEITEIENQRAVEGSCIYIKREIIKRFGGFDEGYGSGYREEVDLAFQIREMGWKVVSCPTAEYIHFGNQTHGKLGITNNTYDYFMSKWGAKLKLGEI